MAIGLILVAAAFGLAVTGDEPPVRVTGTKSVRVTLADSVIRPNRIEVEPGTRLILKVENTGAHPHDLVLATGQRTELLGRGEAEHLEVGPLTEAVDGWCTVPGHRASGMEMRIELTEGPDNRGMAKGDLAPEDGPEGSGESQFGADLDLSAPMSAGWRPYDPVLPPASDVTEHRIEIRASETEREVAPGIRQRVWTFDGTVPGPVLRARVGDRFVITFINDGDLPHGIDFHAGALAPDRPMRTLEPGDRLTYRFTADRAGVWLYHCSTPPMTQHIGNGMYGAVVVDPPDLRPVDREYLLVQGELYLSEPGGPAQVEALREGRPDGWMFNGTAAGYVHRPLTARVGERVRIWVVAAGPSSGTAFHVVGTRFDTVYADGAYLLRPDDPGGAQVLDLAPAQGGFVEMGFPEAGTYPLVDHTMHHAEGGAVGRVVVRGPRR